MERSLTARFARPLGLALPWAPGRASAAPRRRPRAKGRGSSRSGLGLLEHLRAALWLLWRHRRARLALAVVLVSLPVLGGGFLLLRNSALVAVEHVQVAGVHGAEAPAIEAALSAAARHMSTLDVKTGALMAAVAPFRVVSAVRAQASFPHGLRIEVSEQLPVAALLVNGSRTAVTASGLVLGPALVSSTLATLGGYRELVAGQRVGDAALLEALSVLGAAPRVLARHVARVYGGPQGLTLAMRNGLLVYFGDAVRPHAKWTALARVLADHSSAGASYIDVRVPARPAAGFPAGAGPTSSETTSGESASSSESTVSALAAGLTKESGVSPSSGASSSPASGASSGASSSPAGSEAATESGHSSSSEAGETSASNGAEAGQEAAPPSG